MMILDRLGILTDEVSDSFEEALDWAARQNLRYVELRVVDGTNVLDLPDDRVERAAREVSRRGLSVPALASPLFKAALDPSRPVAAGDRFGARKEGVEEHFRKLVRAARIARILGTRRIRVFSFWRERDPRAFFPEITRHLRRAAAFAEGEGMELLLENETSCNGGTAEEIGDLVRAVGSPALRVLWDPGNETSGGRTAFPDGYARVMDLVGHVHLKDAVVGEDGTPRFVPLGSGGTDLKEQILALDRNGYGGIYILEPRFVPEGGTAREGAERSLEGLKRILGEAGLL